MNILAEYTKRKWDFDSSEDAFIKGAEVAIDKACSWLEREFENIGIRWMRGDSAQDLVEQFKKAMEQ